MNVLDLFSGACGGWSLGLHRAGFKTVAACEIDGWRRERFAFNNPGVRMFADICALKAEHVADLAIDVVAGSPPCQDASEANQKGKGIDGERTGLFWEFLRIVRELRPVWVLAENVPGLRTRGYDRIHAALEEAGYSVWPIVVGAWHAGAPHRRNRVWIVALAKQDGRQAALIPVRPRRQDEAAAESLRGSAEPSSESSEEQMGRAGLAWEEAIGIASDTAQERCGTRPGQDEPLSEPALKDWSHWNGGAPFIGGVDDGLPKGVARKLVGAYGDAVVPIIPEIIGRAIMRASQC